MIATCSFDRTAVVWEEIAGEKNGQAQTHWIKKAHLVGKLPPNWVCLKSIMKVMLPEFQNKQWKPSQMGEYEEHQEIGPAYLFQF